MKARPQPASLSRRELEAAVPVGAAELDEMLELGMLGNNDAGRFRASDIQRVRTIQAMRSAGITLAELRPVFEAGFYTLQPMDILYPEPARATDVDHGQLAQSLGLSAAEIARVVVAAGFPAPSPDEPLRQDDLELGRMLIEAGTKMGGGDILYRTARIFGESARRAAEGSLALFTEGVNDPVARDENALRDPRVRQEMNELGAHMMGLAERLVVALFRRHLERAMLAQWALGAEATLDRLGLRPASSANPGLAFVDLSGYTAMTETAGDVAAARLAARLSELAEASAARNGGRVVKLLGDGAMLHFRDPLDAARGALDLVSEAGQAELPPAHAGAHAGPVIERDGDYFGRTVNIASRLSATAAPGQVVVSADIAAEQPQDLRFVPLGERELKGIGTINLFEAVRAT